MHLLVYFSLNGRYSITNMRILLLTQFVSDLNGSHEQECPQIESVHETHATANTEMQKLYDQFVANGCVDSDDSDASHFYVCGDDGTQHWWIVEL